MLPIIPLPRPAWRSDALPTEAEIIRARVAAAERRRRLRFALRILATAIGRRRTPPAERPGRLQPAAC